MGNESINGIEYELIRTKRRSVGVTVTPDGHVTVRAPMRMPKRDIEHMLAERTEWIVRNREKLAERRERYALHTFRPGDTFYLFGEAYSLCVCPGMRAREGASFADGRLCCPDFGQDETACEKTKRAIEKLYRRIAIEYYTERMTTLSRDSGLVFGKLALSDARGRWGSCSARGDIRISWRLVMAPREIADYVLAHELCHTRELNHSAAFWRLVGGIIPDFALRRSWLRENYSMLEF